MTASTGTLIQIDSVFWRPFCFLVIGISYSLLHDLARPCRLCELGDGVGRAPRISLPLLFAGLHPARPKTHLCSDSFGQG